MSRWPPPEGQADHPHLGLEGKTIRATSREPPPVHHLRWYEVASGMVLWHGPGGQQETESSALKPLGTADWVPGRMLTLEAMQTHRARWAQVQRLGGDSLLLAKDNQPTLRAASADLVADRRPDRRRWHEAATWDKAPGRLEPRHILGSPDRNAWGGKEWAGSEQGFRLERTVRLRTTTQLRQEGVFGLSRLSRRHAPPGRRVPRIRAPWASENRLQHRPDVSLGEDAGHTRTGAVKSLLAQLTSTVGSLLDRAGVRKIARQMRYFDAHVEQALALVLTGSCSVSEH